MEGAAQLRPLTAVVRAWVEIEQMEDGNTANADENRILLARVRRELDKKKAEVRGKKYTRASYLVFFFFFNSKS